MAVGSRGHLYGSGGRAAGRAGPGGAGRRALSGPGRRDHAPGRLLLPPSRGEGQLRGGEPGAAPAGQQAGSEGLAAGERPWPAVRGMAVARSGGAAGAAGWWGGAACGPALACGPGDSPGHGQGCGLVPGCGCDRDLALRCDCSHMSGAGPARRGAPVMLTCL